VIGVSYSGVIQKTSCFQHPKVLIFAGVTSEQAGTLDFSWQVLVKQGIIYAFKEMQ